MKRVKTLFMAFFASATAAVAQQESLLSVSGKLLKNDCGETIVLKGVNDMNTYDNNYGTAHIAQIAQTGANTIRMQIDNIPAATVGQLIDAALAAKLIPIVEIQAYIGQGVGDVNWYIAAEGGDWGKRTDATVLSDATNFWTNASLKSVLLARQNYLILNIANEPNGAWTTDDPDNNQAAQAAVDRTSYFNANKTAITTLRNTGYTCPLMIDATANGHDVNFITQYADQLQNFDPQHKLVFSVHAYWDAVAGGTSYHITDAQVTSRMAAVAAVQQPVVFGELAIKDVWCTQDNNGDCVAASSVPINYSLILQKLNDNNLGYIAWWWGNQFMSADAALLAMSSDGTFAHINGADMQALATAISTAVRPYKLVHGSCQGGACSVGITATPNSAICAGTSIKLAGTGATTYAWSGDIANNANFAPSTTTTYTVTGTTGVCTASASYTVTVNPLPIPTVSMAGNVVSTQAFASYQWLLNSTNVNGATAQNYTATQSGTYSVHVTDANGCTGTSAGKEVSVSGIQQLSEIALMKIYPNPFSESFVIETNASEKLTYSVYEITGRELLRQIFAGKTSVEMSAYATGNYVVIVSNNEGLSNRYLVAKQ